jgi:hypothetical protein
LAGVVVFPAVIGAAQAVLFVSPEPQGNAAVRAEFIGERIAAFGISPSEQALGKEFHAHRRAIVFRQLLGEEDGNPVAADQVAHGRSRAGSGHQFVLFARQRLEIVGEQTESADQWQGAGSSCRPQI